MRTDEDALTCDFAETYHVLGWRGLPMRLAATLAGGLGPGSRIQMALAGASFPMETILLSSAVDALQLIAWLIGGDSDRRPAPLTPLLLGETDEYTTMDLEDFKSWRSGILEG